MIKFAIQQWDKNKDRLEEDIRFCLDIYNKRNYYYLVEKIVELIFNNEDEDGYDDKKYSKNGIVEIDNGDYQGTFLYVIPEDTYQPTVSEYLMTHVSYGSCSGCDTLQSIQCWDLEDASEEDKDKMVEDYMKLCLHIVQNTIKPYNYGWRKDKLFDTIENE